MESRPISFVQKNSPDGGFLQSEHWKKFQESVGRKTFSLEERDEKGDTIIFSNAIVHTLPVVGDYFYIPRGPVTEIPNSKFQIPNFFSSLVNLAKENNIGWMRVEPNGEEELNFIKNNLPGIKIKKSTVDMQPREILILDISKSEEEILAGMKQKTRYNIRLAGKRGVKVFASRAEKYVEEFLRLTKITAERDKIAIHPEDYYRKMLEVIPSEILKLYVAEYERKIIAANLVLHFGKTAIYMHGASADDHRNVMAPYLLQWRQIQDAKKEGCARYDFGGVSIKSLIPASPAGRQIPKSKNTWEGITRFKTGFAPEVEPIKFPGCNDVILNPARYSLYRLLQKVKRLF